MIEIKNHSAIDDENCKGQCGFTTWCRECKTETEKRIKKRENRLEQEEEPRGFCKSR